MDIIYDRNISHRRALEIDKIWSDSDATPRLHGEVLGMASLKGSEKI